MAATIITTEDLHEFKLELLDDIKNLMNNQSGHQQKKWLKSNGVRHLSWDTTKSSNQRNITLFQNRWSDLL